MLILGSLGLGLVVVTLVPHASKGGSEPPVGLLLLGGVLIAAATVPALFVAVTKELKLPISVALFAIGYNALIALVKFALAPKGLYDVNQTVALTGFFTPSDPTGAVIAAAVVFAIYFAVYAVIYRVFRARIYRLLQAPEPERTIRLRRSTVPLVAGALLLAMTGGVALLAIPLFAVSSGLEYLKFVFSSGLSVVISLVLAGAASLAVLSFRGAAERARLVEDATVLVGFFWLGLAFLAVYHVLWVVYILVLTSVWPLRVVVPK
jgi:hypothetical protein